MKVEVLLERNSDVIVHENVKEVVPHREGNGSMVWFNDDTWIFYPYRNLSYFKVN